MSEPAPDKAQGSKVRILLIVGAVLVVGVLGWWLANRGDDARERGLGNYDFSDASRIYRGRAALARNPAVVNSSQVYTHIPEYQQILKEGLKDDKPRYHFLMREATKRFNHGVSAAARAARHDVVAEVGTCTPQKPGVPEPPDITSAVIAKLPGGP